MLTLIDTVSETVKQSLITFAEQQLKSNANCLSSALVCEVSAALEESVNEAAKAGLKAFIEQFECEQKQIQRDGRVYRLRERSSKKKFLTIFGEIELSRRYYHCAKGGAGIVALDEAWEMESRYATPEVTESILWLSALLVPGEVSEACARMCRFTPSPSCIQDLIGRDAAGMAQMLEAEDGAQSRGIEVPEQREVFVASLDGANVLLREKGVKRGRPSERPGLNDRHQTSEPQGSSYKNAMVGSFSFYRRTDGVLDIESGLEGIVPERLNSIYCARMPQERAYGFKKEFESILALISEDLDEQVTKILLIDGARPLWNYLKNNPLFKGYRMLLDFFHGSEHLSLASEALFGKQSEKGKRWYEKWRFKLKYEEGAIDGILRSIARYEKGAALPKSRGEDLAREIGFFKRNKAHMNYHEHVANGWPIGSGPVEAACKTIVKARLCQSGMRWSRTGGRNILALRVLTKSHHWDHAWKQYRALHWATRAA